MKLHIPEELRTQAEQIRLGAETIPGILRLALQRGLEDLKQDRSQPQPSSTRPSSIRPTLVGYFREGTEGAQVLELTPDGMAALLAETEGS